MRAFKIAALSAAIMAAGVGAASPVATIAGTSTNIPADRLRFYQNRDGLTFANARGDPDRGSHSNYIRLPAKSASPLHVHTLSYYGVVIQGTVSNERKGRPDRPLPNGSYWFQKGGEPHVTKCLSGIRCLIFVTSPRRFDIRPVAAAARETGPRELRR